MSTRTAVDFMLQLVAVDAAGNESAPQEVSVASTPPVLGGAYPLPPLSGSGTTVPGDLVALRGSTTSIAASFGPNTGAVVREQRGVQEHHLPRTGLQRAAPACLRPGMKARLDGEGEPRRVNHLRSNQSGQLGGFAVRARPGTLDVGGAMSGSRVISSRDTFFAKVVLSAALLFGVGWMVWATWQEAVHPGAHGVSPLQVVYYLLGIVWATWHLFRWCLPLKRVILADTSLRVSNFLREVVVPLRDVESVHQREGSESIIIVGFARKTALGRRILFSGIGWKPAQPHPIVAELRAVVAAAGATG